MPNHHRSDSHVWSQFVQTIDRSGLNFLKREPNFSKDWKKKNWWRTLTFSCSEQKLHRKKNWRQKIRILTQLVLPKVGWYILIRGLEARAKSSGFCCWSKFVCVAFKGTAGHSQDTLDLGWLLSWNLNRLLCHAKCNQ